MNRADDNQIENIVYVLLMLAAVTSIGLVVQPKFNFSSQGALFYGVVAIIAFAIDILGLKRVALSQKLRWAIGRL